MQNDPKTPSSPSGNKRGRESSGSVNANPTKKSKPEPSRSKMRSAFLLLITKGGRNYEHLNKDDVHQIRDQMVSDYYAGDDDPLIDWIRHVNGRALCACDSLETVSWVKTFVRKVNAGYGAWLPREGPNSRTLEVLVPPPAANKIDPERIIQKMKSTNRLPGNCLILFTKKIPGDRRVILRRQGILRGPQTERIQRPYWNR